MTGVSHLKCVSYGYIIPKLPDYHNIRVLPHGLYDSVSERFNVSAYLSMPDNTFLRLMNQLYRCRNNHNVPPYRTVVCINNGVERSRFTGARNPGYQR